MSMPLRLSSFDRLTIDWQTYRFRSQTDEGYSFESTSPPAPTVFFGFGELRDLLKQPDVLLERGYFLVERETLRKTTKFDAVGVLSDAERSEVVWRDAYVSFYFQFEAHGEVNRTEASVKQCLSRIEALVNKQASAAQGGWVKKRAGTRKEYRDSPCARTLLEWVRRFEAAAASPLGLIPKTHRSGNRKARFSLEEMRLLGLCIGGYLTRDRLSKRQIADNCKTLFEEENKKRAEEGLTPLTVPSKRKVEREISKLDPYATYAQRHGVEAANRKFMLYEDGIDASYPMERVEIDEWCVDLITILAQRGALDGLSRDQLAALPTGRRWLYLAIDCATRCVVGMRLAVQPSSEDAIALLSDVTRDKTDLAIAAGCKSAWAHYGGLKTVATDLGIAFVDDSFRAAIFDVQGSPETPTGGLPQLRARVERIFGTFGTNLLPGLAGRTFSNPKEKGDYPSREMASIADDALIQMLILYVVDVYHNRPHRGLQGETPNNCWKRLAMEKGVVPDVPERVRRRAFGKLLRRRVTGRGVRVFGIDYTCAALRRFHLHSHEQDVDLRIDFNDLGWIVVMVGDEWFSAQALQKCFEGISYDVWEAAARQLRQRYRAEAAIHEETVARALDKIGEVNSAEQSRFGAVLQAVTPAGLQRGEEDLYLGLSILPDDPEGFDLPPEEDLFGHQIPQPKADGGGEFTAPETGGGAGAANDAQPSTWRFDDE
ncbi:Mu transposase C-terminal domain-containing protein [Phaeobacter inhibens]|uniref:Mu transposase C-terminal domain-containing protein n=1 Tax=Phaeobacter inhibens TaxID=221822 RepID=UPI0021A4AA76|nr:Mu transposase C-terminal domain-containing protein [Phaeobacter inhibens]UWR60195.1 Mu transposase C-terminal domain-containing protein [Phaeobacter inhibens]